MLDTNDDGQHLRKRLILPEPHDTLLHRLLAIRVADVGQLRMPGTERVVAPAIPNASAAATVSTVVGGGRDRRGAQRSYKRRFQSPLVDADEREQDSVPFHSNDE